MLYLPRGWWHEVTPLPEPSLHLSVGIYVPSVLDALGWLCQRVLPLELTARRGAIDEAATSRDLAALVDVLRSCARRSRTHVPPARRARGSRPPHQRILSRHRLRR